MHEKTIHILQLNINETFCHLHTDDVKSNPDAEYSLDAEISNCNGCIKEYHNPLNNSKSRAIHLKAQIAAKKWAIVNKANDVYTSPEMHTAFLDGFIAGKSRF